MAGRITIVGAKPKKIGILDKPKRRIDPAEVAAALGAKPCGPITSGNLDLIALGELGSQLLKRLRSSGGRPALADATEICRVPLSSDDVKALEEVLKRVEESTGAKPSLGQLVSVIVRSSLPADEAAGQERAAELAALRQEVERLRERNATLERRMANIAEISAAAGRV